MVTPALKLCSLAAGLLILVLGTGNLLQEPDRPNLAFALTDHQQQPRTETDYIGKPVVMFFGFTRCIGVCPTALRRLSAALKEMSPAPELLFVTVDPERDTPDVMAAYVSLYDYPVTGLTGSAEHIGGLAERLKVYAQAVGEGDQINHSAHAYLFSEQGRLLEWLHVSENPTELAMHMARVLGTGG